MRFFRVIVYRRVLTISSCHFNPRTHSRRGQNVNTTKANQHQQKKVKEHTNLRYILGDYSPLYTTLLSKVNSTSLCNKCVQNFLMLLYKNLFFTHFPAYMKNMFSLRSSSYDLRRNYILSLSQGHSTRI